MKRLTFEGNFCDIAQCRELPCPYNGACSQRKVWEKLKAYEDTELTPEQCANAKTIVESAFSDDTSKFEQADIGKTVFLAREEAEKALKERRGDNEAD